MGGGGKGGSKEELSSLKKRLDAVEFWGRRKEKCFCLVKNTRASIVAVVVVAMIVAGFFEFVLCETRRGRGRRRRRRRRRGIMLLHLLSLIRLFIFQQHRKHRSIHQTSSHTGPGEERRAGFPLRFGDQPLHSHPNQRIQNRNLFHNCAKPRNQ